METSQLLTALLDHDRWATGQIFHACRSLDEQRLHQRFAIGPGSLHDTLAHILASMRAWTDSLAGGEARPRVDDGRRLSLAELVAMHATSADELDREAHRRPLNEFVTRTTRDGRTFSLSRADVLMQVTTHGVHHRAQCSNMLRHLEATPLPPTSFVEWTRARGRGTDASGSRS